MADHAASRSSFAIVSSPAAYARLDAVQSFIKGLPPSLELLLVGHTREAVDDVARDVTRSRGASFGVHRFSMRQLASRLAAIELARHGQAVASPLGAEAVAARAAFDALDTGVLDYLTPIARLRSIGQTLRSTLDDLRAADVDVGELSAHGARGDDVRVLAEGFGAQLSDAGLVDRSALFRTAAAALDAVVWVPVTGPLVLVDVEIHDAAVLALVRALCNRASHILVTVPTGDDQTLDALTRLPGAPSPTRVGTPRAPGGDALDSVREYLFDSTTPPEPESPAPTDLPSVKLFSAPGEGRECVEIARAALAEAERGVPLDRMAILVRAPQLYGGLLETALDRAGLPGWFVRGTRVPDPSGRAYLALLACAAEQLSARRFAEYLSLAQVPMLSDDGGPPQGSPQWVPPDSASTELPAQAVPAQLSLFDLSGPEAEPTGDHEAVPAQPVVAGSLRAPRQWDRLLVESAVIGGRSRWTRRLDGLAEELRLRRAEHASDDPESPRVRALERDLENLSHLRRFALPVIDALAAFPSRATWGLWLDQLERLTPMVLKDPERVQSVLGELRPMARVGPVALASGCALTSRDGCTAWPTRMASGCRFTASLDSGLAAGTAETRPACPTRSHSTASGNFTESSMRSRRGQDRASMATCGSPITRLAGIGRAREWSWGTVRFCSLCCTVSPSRRPLAVRFTRPGSSSARSPGVLPRGRCPLAPMSAARGSRCWKSSIGR